MLVHPAVTECCSTQSIPHFTGKIAREEILSNLDSVTHRHLRTPCHDLFSFIQLREAQSTEQIKYCLPVSCKVVFVSKKGTPGVILFRLNIFVFFHHIS